MKLTAKVKLQPNPEQAQALQDTLKTTNRACDYISQVAWSEKVFSQFKVHKLVYQRVKERFGLTAQVVVRAILSDG